MSLRLLLMLSPHHGDARLRINHFDALCHFLVLVRGGSVSLCPFKSLLRGMEFFATDSIPHTLVRVSFLRRLPNGPVEVRLHALDILFA